MRPIWMKIKGLNSFQEAQEVDFEQLASQGLFGIFGPTGSGKSSILDGMTLALYGTTARNSANFINVNTDRGSVDYIFSVKEKQEKTYRVSRSFRRSKEGSIRSDGAKFLELTGQEPVILADRVGTVNEKCREVLGLSKEDFFRTVVLPQGKFSEFLKLEGMERNKMLERLFHLEQYGEHLAALVKHRAGQWDGQKKEKEGALSRYEEVSEEEIARLTNQERSLSARLMENTQQLETFRKQLEEARTTAMLQQEYEKLQKELLGLEAKKEEIQKLGIQVQQAETANLLWDWLRDARSAKEQVQTQQKAKESTFTKWQQKQEQLRQAEEENKEAGDRLQKEKPTLQFQKELLKQAMTLAKESQELEHTRQIQQKEKRETDQKLAEAKGKMEALLQDIENRRKQKETFKKEVQDVAVPVEIQQTAAEGDRLTRDLQQREKQRTEQDSRRKQYSLELEKTNREAQQISREKERSQKLLQQLEREIAELKKQVESYQNLEAEQEGIFKLQEAYQREQELGAKLQEEERLHEKTKADFEKACETKNLAAHKKSVSEQRYLENMAGILAAELKEGEPCPVCGSVHHVTKAAAHLEDTEKLTRRKQQAEQDFQAALAEVSRLETSLLHIRENLAPLHEEYKLLQKKAPKEQLKKAKAAYESKEAARTAAKNSLEKKTAAWETQQETFHKLQNQQTKLEMQEQNLAQRIEEAEKELQKLSQETEAPRERLLKLKEMLQKEDFCAFYEEIQEKLKEYEVKQTRLNQLETQIEARVRNSEKGRNLIESLTTKQTELSVLLAQSGKRAEELEHQIQERAGTTEDLEERQTALENALQNLETTQQQAAARWGQLQKEERALQEAYTEQKALTQSVLAKAEEKQKTLESKMKEASVTEEGWIETHKEEEALLGTWKEEIKAYEEKVVKLHTQSEQVSIQLGDRAVLPQQLTSLEEKVQGLAQELTEANKTLGAVKKELEQTEKAWEEKKKLVKSLEEIYHMLDLLAELEGLFKGKRFVEYVSRYYLEYVSREADQQLRKMTGGSYGLETDGTGMFLIRDYKNGGALRPASTLSGGETFMASLALALALSSQIQMKGAAPLELFFLDEGFGTLDETCLEVVMEALESIRSKRRSVGVITHVEEIKSRIPVRLLVEPARMGEGGSRLHIESV